MKVRHYTPENGFSAEMISCNNIRDLLAAIWCAVEEEFESKSLQTAPINGEVAEKSGFAQAFEVTVDVGRMTRLVAVSDSPLESLSS